MAVTYAADGPVGTITLDNAQARFTTTLLTAGSHKITLVYTPDTDLFTGAASSTLTQKVSTATLLVSVDNESMYYGGSVPTLTGTITGLQDNDNITAGSPPFDQTTLRWTFSAGVCSPASNITRITRSEMLSMR